MCTRCHDRGSLQRSAFRRVALLILLPALAALPAAQPAAAAVCAGSFGFASSANVATGRNPMSLAAGDLNGDGRLDLVTANYTDNTISVLLASGSAGSFAPRVDYSTGSGLSTVIVSDLNNDGRPDLAVTNTVSATVGVFLASGAAGSFASQSTYIVGNGPDSIAAGDFNGDGWPDLAVANSGDNTVSILLSSGSAGGFAPKVDYASGYGGFVAAADLNGDGRLDLAVTNPPANTVSVLLASGSPGSFAPRIAYSTDNWPSGMAIGDLNGDGRLDLAIANTGANTVSVLLASGSAGSFAAHVDYATGSTPTTVAVADLNRDGRLDLAVSNKGGLGSLSVLLASGSAGSFASKLDYPVGRAPFSLIVGELNADGLPDIAVANSSDDTVSILLNNSTPNPGGNFASKVDYNTGSHPSSVVIGDLNGDGRQDLAVGNRYSNSVSVLLANGSPGNFASKVDYASGGTVFFLATGDLNNDGRLDLIATNDTSNSVSVFLASGSPGTFAPKVDYGVGIAPFGIAVGDLNGDGRLDLAIANQLSDTVTVLFASGSSGSFAPKVGIATGDNPRSVAIGDLNGDGRPDLEVANAASSTMSVLLASGSPGSFAPKVDYSLGYYPFSLALGDLNGDGRLDVAVANASNINTVNVLLASGSPGSFAPKVDYSVDGPFSLAIGDLNGDGRLDLATAGNPKFMASVLLAGGSPGTFAPKTDFPAGQLPVSIAIGDLNGDSQPDLAVANHDADTVSVLMNLPMTATFSLDTPSGATTGSTFSITATLQDACGNVATGFSGPVALAIKPGTGAAGAALGGTTTVNAVNGVASFSGLSIDKRASGYVLVASADGALAGESAAFAVGNAPPVARDDSFSTYEDTPLPPTIDALANDTDADGDALIGSLISGPSHGTNGATYMPFADYNGADSATYRVYDGAAFSNVATIHITILPVNDAPSFTKGADQAVNEDAGAQSVNGWATGIRPGPPTALDEAGQALSFLVANDNSALFAVQPAIAADGTLSYTPAQDASGSATITARLRDDGGTANGGADTSALQTFTIAINAVNDPPTLDAIGDLSLPEDAGARQVDLSGIGAGAASESRQSLAVTATSDNPTLIPNPVVSYSSPSSAATLSFNTAANASGTAAITVRVSDDGGTANGGIDFVERSFIVTVLPVNDAPDFAAGPNLAIGAAAGPQIVAGWAGGFTPGPADEASQTLLGYTVVGDSNPSLFAVPPAVDRFGTLAYTPRPGAAGLAAIEVVARDSGGTANGGADTSAARAFTITVAPEYRTYLPLVAR